MHKKYLSLLLALSISANLGIPVFAADEQTEVTYIGTGAESYLLTVPAKLEPGENGEVSLKGTWASNRKIEVTSDTSVELKSSIGGEVKH